MELILSLSIFVSVMCFLKTRTLVKELESLETNLDKATEELGYLEAKLNEANKELDSFKVQTPLDLTGLFIHK